MSPSRRRVILPLALVPLAAAAAMAFARPAEALPCSALPNRVMVAGSGKVIIADLARALSGSGISLIYKLQGSCLAVDAILNKTTIGTAASLATYWDVNAEQTCELDSQSDTADIGISDVFPSTCQNLPNGLPMDVRDFGGPVEAYTFVVPKASKERSISRAAAYFVFGFGGDSGVLPWTDAASIFQRDASSGTQQMFAIAIGVPPERWRGTSASSSGALVTGLGGVAQPDKAIGILTAEVADANRASINVLAYQDAGQSCGYWPDTTPTAHDKRNVRDGHYALWGPLHLLTKVDKAGYTLDPNARDVIAYLTGTKSPTKSFDLISLLADAGLVPACAMHVQRTSELGALASFQPERPCGCYFDQVTTGMTTCKPCASDGDCAGPAQGCSYGYCEAR